MAHMAIAFAGDEDFEARYELADEDAIKGDPSRYEKSKVNYKMKATRRLCETCAHYVAQTPTLGLCLKVKGVIDAQGTCDVYADWDGVGEHSPKREVQKSDY